MVREAGKTAVKELKVTKAELKPLVEKYEETLHKLPEIIKVKQPLPCAA